MVSLLLAVLIGLAMATQWSILGSLGRESGSLQIAWFSGLTPLSVLGLLVVANRVFSGADYSAFNSIIRYEWLIIITLVGSIGLVTVANNLPWWSFCSGLFGLALIVGAAYLVPRIGVAEFFVAVTLGSAIGGVILDHIGAFGNPTTLFSPLRILGLLAIMLGVLLVRIGNFWQE